MTDLCVTGITLIFFVFLGWAIYLSHKNRCVHTREVIQKISVYPEYGGDMPCGTKYVTRCTKCGLVEVTKA